MDYKSFKDAVFTSELTFLKNCDLVSDSSYWEFIKNHGDGYYFNKSLHLYGNSKKYNFHDAYYRTNLIKNSYNEILNENDLFAFGEDAFGNQFVFYSSGIGLLLIESGEIEYISKDFSKWLDEINEDLDYYTGESLLVYYSKQNADITYGERLSPKIPFILGGEYNVSNLHVLFFDKLIEFNSNIANQIFELPDGEAIKIRVGSQSNCR